MITTKPKITTRYLDDNLTGVDQVSKKKDGTIVFRRGFYYRHGMDAEKFVASVTNQLTTLGIGFWVLDCGEKFTSFRGGASLANSSHWYLVIGLTESKPQP